MCRIAFQRDTSYDHNALRHIPVSMRSEFYVAAIQDGWLTLDEVPYSRRTPKMCMAAVQQIEPQLYAVPDNLKTQEICLKAVRKDGCLLEDVPVSMRTPEVCLEAIRDIEDDIEAMRMLKEEIPSAIKNDPGFAKRAVMMQPSGIAFTSQSQKLCLKAVEEWGSKAMQYIDSDINKKICLNAIKLGDYFDYSASQKKKSHTR